MARRSAERQEERKLTVSLVQGIEAVACTFLLICGFAFAGRPGAIWALVSAVIVLRPGFQESFHASRARVAANLVGALVGVAVGSTMGSQPAAIALALFLVILMCHWQPLQVGVRSACSGVVIVMMHEGHIRESGFERFLAVVIGCCVALIIGFLGDRLYRRFRPQMR
jgi:uncharacterized membrane protein YgaE (UPF0421/DUF939 family)